MDAREKISAAAKSSPGGGVNRERRNSFRKAVDRVDPASLSAADRRTYEQIWMRGGNLDCDENIIGAIKNFVLHFKIAILNFPLLLSLNLYCFLSP